MAEFSLDDHYIVATKPSTRFPVYTRANVGEVWIGPGTPLTASSMAGWPFEHAWRDALVRIGAFDLDEFDSEHQELLGVFYGYLYLNLSVQRVFGVRMPGASADIIDSSFFGGGAENVPPYVADPRDDSPAHAEKMTETIGWSLSVESLPQLDEQRAKVMALRRNRPDLATATNHELFAYASPFLTSGQQRLMTEHMPMLSPSACSRRILWMVNSSVIWMCSSPSRRNAASTQTPRAPCCQSAQPSIRSPRRT